MHTGKEWSFFIIAIILGATGFWTLIEGLLKHWMGGMLQPLLHYLAGFFLIGLAKFFKWKACCQETTGKKK